MKQKWLSLTALFLFLFSALSVSAKDQYVLKDTAQYTEVFVQRFVEEPNADGLMVNHMVYLYRQDGSYVGGQVYVVEEYYDMDWNWMGYREFSADLPVGILSEKQLKGTLDLHFTVDGFAFLQEPWNEEDPWPEPEYVPETRRIDLRLTLTDKVRVLSKYSEKSFERYSFQRHGTQYGALVEGSVDDMDFTGAYGEVRSSKERMMVKGKADGVYAENANTGSKLTYMHRDKMLYIGADWMDFDEETGDISHYTYLYLERMDSSTYYLNVVEQRFDEDMVFLRYFQASVPADALTLPKKIGDLATLHLQVDGELTTLNYSIWDEEVYFPDPVPYTMDLHVMMNLNFSGSSKSMDKYTSTTFREMSKSSTMHFYGDATGTIDGTSYEGGYCFIGSGKTFHRYSEKLMGK